MIHELRVIGAHAKVATAHELQYRSNFWMAALNTLIMLIVSLAGIGIVFSHVETLRGWSSSDMHVLLGTFFVLGSYINGILHRSMSTFTSDVASGSFDFLLLKPVDAQVVAAGQTPQPWRLLNLAAGLTLIAIGVSNQGFDEVSGGVIGALLAAATMLACSICIVTGFWALMASITFWTIEGEGILWALDDMYDHLRWPLQIFPPGLRIALSTVYPAGFAITVPASALTGRLGLSTALIACATAAAFLIAARLVWRVAIRRYEGANS